MSEISSTCILYFTTGNTSIKSFSSKKNNSSAIQKTLFKKTLQEIRRSGLDYIVSDGRKAGYSFEDRIKSVISSIFEKGYQNILVVGDDTPDLSSKQLLFSYHQLQEGKICIGPSLDGGSYLLGFSRNHFQKGILNNLAWQTNHFYKSLVYQLILSGFDFSTLPQLSDIDNHHDLVDFIKKSLSKLIGIVLDRLLNYIIPSSLRHLQFQNAVLSASSNRGPPQLALPLL